MADNRFLTPEEVSQRYRGTVSPGTLRNWRSMKIGPSFVKIGKAEGGASLSIDFPSFGCIG